MDATDLTVRRCAVAVAVATIGIASISHGQEADTHHAVVGPGSGPNLAVAANGTVVLSYVERRESGHALVYHLVERGDLSERIIITGYIPHSGQYQGAFLPGFEEQVPESLRKLVFGSHASTILHRRALDMEVGSADPGFYIDCWSLSSNDPQTMEVGEMSWQGAVEFV